jgi:hypothetical protein
VTGVTFEQICERERVAQTQALRLGDRPFEPMPADDGGQVEKKHTASVGLIEHCGIVACVLSRDSTHL